MEMVFRILLGLFFLYGIIWGGHHVAENIQRKEWAEGIGGIIAVIVFVVLFSWIVYFWGEI